jgi:hypothetical protein
MPDAQLINSKTIKRASKLYGKNLLEEENEHK